MVWVFTPFSVIFGLIVFFLVLREMRRNPLSTQIQGAPDTEVSDPEHLD